MLLPSTLLSAKSFIMPSTVKKSLLPIFILSLCLNCYALPSTPGLQLPSHLVTQFPHIAWIENTAARSNGDLLFTELKPQPILYTVINPASTSPNVSVIHDFSLNETQSLLGIAETSNDVFVVVSAANSTGLFVAWSVNLKSKPGPHISKITELVGAKLPNGVTNVPGCPEQVLIADSFAGLVWSLNTVTKSLQVAVQVPEMVPPANITGRTPVGVNGIKMHDNYLYWTNSALATVYRIKIGAGGGTAEKQAKVEVVAKLPVSFVDDFVINDQGVLFAMASSDNQVWATSARPGGRTVAVIGGKDQATVSGATAGAMGRGKGDKHILYVVTSGADIHGNLTATEGGKVVAVDTRSFSI
ncbi:hypothetical protein QBC43DRAFT_328205 [Cladorrhinum sp. PSN259]|nr:hypothetical protein QBC43DRAFT_328205 [Cladorrhinum sp. PSN259]